LDVIYSIYFICRLYTVHKSNYTPTPLGVWSWREITSGGTWTKKLSANVLAQWGTRHSHEIQKICVLPFFFLFLKNLRCYKCEANTYCVGLHGNNDFCGELCYNRVMTIFKPWLGCWKAPPCQWNVDIELNIPDGCVPHLLDRSEVLCNFCLRWLNGFRCFPLGQVASTSQTIGASVCSRFFQSSHNLTDICEPIV
jgi:hypothetical protein